MRKRKEKGGKNRCHFPISKPSRGKIWVENRKEILIFLPSTFSIYLLSFPSPFPRLASDF